MPDYEVDHDDDRSSTSATPRSPGSSKLPITFTPGQRRRRRAARTELGSDPIDDRRDVRPTRARLPRPRPRPGAHAARPPGQGCRRACSAERRSTRSCWPATARCATRRGADMMDVGAASGTCTSPPSRSCSPGGRPTSSLPYPGGCATGPAADHVHGPLLVEFDEGVAALAGALADLVGAGERDGGFDDLVGARARTARRPLAPKPAIGDAGSVLAAAKMLQDRRRDRVHQAGPADQRVGDVRRVRRAPARASARPTCPGSSCRRIFELGRRPRNPVDPIWQADAAVDRRTARTRCTATSPSRLNSTDRILRDGDLVIIDSGILYEGYASDFGRTWSVGRPADSPQQVDQCKRWKDVVGECSPSPDPGPPASSSTAPPRRGETARRPWLDHFYLIHGIGTDSAEMPFIGTDLGEEFDESIVLAPGHGHGARAGHLGRRRRRLPLRGHRGRHRGRLPRA